MELQTTLTGGFVMAGAPVTSESPDARRRRHKRANKKLSDERMRVKLYAMLINWPLTKGIRK